MANFERKSMEQLLQRMVNWTRGVTRKLTDFRVGSRVRTLYESTALVVEGMYDDVFRYVRVLIEDNIYTVMGFPKRPAVYATARVTFSRTSPADTNYIIPAGTIIRTRATETRAPVEFRTSTDALLLQGTSSIDVPVTCLVAGTIGNVEANTITEFVAKPAGIDAVTNASAISTGQDEETRDQQKVRFQKFIQSLSRGTPPAIEYGAMTAELRDSEGILVERVVTARAFEYLPERRGEVDVYIWNGVGTASPELLSEVERVVTGYYDNETGEPVYGYKSAGIVAYYYSALVNDVIIKLDITPEVGVELDELKPYIEREIDEFFSSLSLGQTVVQTALETRVKLIAGVYDVKVWLSTDDGTTYTQDNITPSSGTEICAVKKPLLYEG